MRTLAEDEARLQEAWQNLTTAVCIALAPMLETLTLYVGLRAAGHSHRAAVRWMRVSRGLASRHSQGGPAGVSADLFRALGE